MSLAADVPAFEDPQLERLLFAGRPTWAYVDLDALAANYRTVLALLPEGADVMAVIKADAYGLGAVPVARTLEREGAPWFGVATLEEGAALRAAGIGARILLLGSVFPEQAGVTVEAGLTPAVFSLDTLRALASAARGRSQPLPVHLKVDTGMGRLGVPWHELATFLDSATELAPGGTLRLEGVFTHLARADETAAEALAWTEEQARRFRQCREVLESRGHASLLTHSSGSAAALHGLDPGCTLARPGLALYGVDPRGSRELRPVLHWSTRILQRKELRAGDPVGYGSTWQATAACPLATLPVGYRDGYDRRLSNVGQVRIAGRRCPVVGRVSMDLVTVDLSPVPDSRPGRTVWLVGGPEGGDPPVDLAEMSSVLDCIPYEILCSLERRVPRLYLREGIVVSARLEPQDPDS